MVASLWGEVFEQKDTSSEVQSVLKKLQNPKTTEVSVEKILKSKKTSLKDKLLLINENVQKILGVYKEKTVVIHTREQLRDYIDAAIKNGIIAIDTETNNSLDPLTCKLMGPCIYTPGQKNAYIPINHFDSDTNERLSNQVTEQDVKEEFERLRDTKILTHNGTFDYQVVKCTTGYTMHIYWDTMVGARILDENERAGLKIQYITKIDPSIEKYSIDHLFKDVPYGAVDPDIFALYAATDAYMTYMLYQYQVKQFENPDLKRVFYVFREIEMPLIEIVAEMEMKGVYINQDYAKRLQDKYAKKSEEVEVAIAKEVEGYAKQIAEWRLTPEANVKPPKKTGDGLGNSKSELLQDPPSTSSPLQLAILLYDVLKVKSVDKENPRSTGEAALKAIDLPLCRLMLEKRGIDKLRSVFIDKLPAAVNPTDHRLHAHFNQNGTDTGRFSSSDPNLQQIPSHNREIRMMFAAETGHKFVGGDFSQQEPRLFSCLSGDESMINAYKEGRDLYATVASIVHNNGYWDNMEHYEDGSPNPEGKKRRQDIKSVVLGLLYGRGAASVAEQIGTTTQEAQELIDKFFGGFPSVKAWVANTQKHAHEMGYVEDLWGRRRRLPDIKLPRYEVSMEGEDAVSQTLNFNPLLGSLGKIEKQKNPLIAEYEKLLEGCRGKKDSDAVIAKAKKDHVIIKNNTGFISQAERQCVNSRIQGSAASMSKRALIQIWRDPELQRMQFMPLILVHDEIIGECPAEYAEAVAERMSHIMRHSAEPECTVPFKTDCELTNCWYESEYYDDLQKEFDDLCKTNSVKDSINKILTSHAEITKEDFDSHIKLPEENS